MTRIFNLRAIGENREGGQSDINADRVREHGSGSPDFARKANVILSGFAQQGHGFDRAFHGEVKLDLDLTKALKAKLPRCAAIGNRRHNSGT
ncbi:MAG: hypothetical protein KIT57_20670 [Blastocatellales bacterium]|nr:hypothetical protein [Blastocatellales bacterium]